MNESSGPQPRKGEQGMGNIERYEWSWDQMWPTRDGEFTWAADAIAWQSTSRLLAREVLRLRGKEATEAQIQCVLDEFADAARRAE
jgi:2,4-dienoyl-CoA reductase-like NADH-dependent reductase (Old Yellow Enzyme family)